MKRNLFLFTVITVFIIGCFPYSPLITSGGTVLRNTERWVEYELIPSNINYEGEPFFNRNLADGSILTVFYDKKVSENSSYFYNLLWQDLGWYSDGGKWNSPGGMPRPKASHLYVNPKRRVAVYLDYKKNHSSFKVRITN